LANFVKRLTKYFKDGKLTKIPKTCDKMGEINQRNRKINNDITNVQTSIHRWKAIAPVDPEAHFAKLLALEAKLQEAKGAKQASRL
jgi:hypothetical protein